MRLFALSDIHIDHKKNNEWIHNLSNIEFKEDALLLAGDITHDLGLLEVTFEVFLSKFKYLFFVPGNHDWKKSSWGSPGGAFSQERKTDPAMRRCSPRRFRRTSLPEKSEPAKRSSTRPYNAEHASSRRPWGLRLSPCWLSAGAPST